MRRLSGLGLVDPPSVAPRGGWALLLTNVGLSFEFLRIDVEQRRVLRSGVQRGCPEPPQEPQGWRGGPPTVVLHVRRLGAEERWSRSRSVQRVGQARLELTTSAPYLGGTRFWFRCPRPTCARRCRVLYFPRQAQDLAPALACRMCHGLRYRTQRLAPADRLEHRAACLVARLGGEAPDGLVYKSQRMRWATFHRRMDVVQALNGAAFALRLAPLLRILSGGNRAGRLTSAHSERRSGVTIPSLAK